jgi:hypothetical protein
MNFNKQKKTTIAFGLWQRFVDSLTTRFSNLLTKVIHFRMMPEAWLPPGMRKRIQKPEKAGVEVYVDKQTHLLLDHRLIVGHHLHSYKSLDIVLRFVETQPPQGYTKIVQILRNNTS